MATYRAPTPFAPGADPAIAWDLWREDFAIFSAATELTAKSIDVQINTFLHVVGPDARRTYHTLTLPQAPAVGAAAGLDPRSLAAIYDAFTAHYEPYRNLTVLRHRFASTRQGPGQPFEQFITDLKTHAKLCAYGALTDSLVCTQLVLGIVDNTLRAKLLAQPTLTLQEAITMCRADETSLQHASAISASHPLHPSLSDAAGSLDAVAFYPRGRSLFRSSRPPRQSAYAPHGSPSRQWQNPGFDTRDFTSRYPGPPPPRRGAHPSRSVPPRSPGGGPPRGSTCFYCGLSHEPLASRCPARGTTCSR